VVKYFRQLAATTISLAVLIWVSLAGAAQAVPLDVQTTGRAHKGEPFLVTVTCPRPMEKVTITWLGRHVPAMVNREGGLFRAMALLGTDVRNVYGSHEQLTVQALVQGKLTSHSLMVEIYEKAYPVQRLTVDPNMVTPPKEFRPRIEEERKIVGAALATITPERFWEVPLLRPTTGRISSVYGLRRVFNDEPRAPHRGIDISAPQGRQILAVEKGMVILIGDHYYAGQSVYVDHGQGVISAYLHLSEIAVRRGQAVLRGELVGKVGSTGRVTGPHLHFGLYVLGQAVDPLPLLLAEEG